MNRNCDDDLLFSQIPLPEQLLQTDEKDGDESTNSLLNTIHKRNRISFDVVEPTIVDKNQQQQDEMNVSLICQFHCDL